MNTPNNGQPPKPPSPLPGQKDSQFVYFSQMLSQPVCAGKIKDRIGKLSDLVVRLSDPFPEIVGIYLEHGWGWNAEAAILSSRTSKAE